MLKRAFGRGTRGTSVAARAISAGDAVGRAYGRSNAAFRWLPAGLDVFFPLFRTTMAQIPVFLRLPIRLNHGPPVQWSLVIACGQAGPRRRWHPFVVGFSCV